MSSRPNFLSQRPVTPPPSSHPSRQKTEPHPPLEREVVDGGGAGLFLIIFLMLMAGLAWAFF